MSIFICTFGLQVALIVPCNSSQNSLFCDREVGIESGNCDFSNLEDCFVLPVTTEEILFAAPIGDLKI